MRSYRGPCTVVDVTDTVHATAPPGTIEPRRGVERAFSWSLVVSGIRCTLAYVVLPFAAPLVGLAPGVGPTIGLAVGAVAIVANVVSYRRFQRSAHRWRRPAMAIHVGVLGLLAVLMVVDAASLLG